MAVSSCGFIFDRTGVSATLFSVSLLFAVAAVAQDRKDAGQCDGKGAPEVQIEHCTAAIDAKIFAGKDLALVFNNRGLASYARHDFGRAIADFTEAVNLDVDFAH